MCYRRKKGEQGGQDESAMAGHGGVDGVRTWEFGIEVMMVYSSSQSSIRDMDAVRLEKPGKKRERMGAV